MRAFLTVLSKILFKNLGARSQATEVSYQGGTWRYRIIVVQWSLTPLEVERNHLPLPVEIKSNKSKKALTATLLTICTHKFADDIVRLVYATVTLI